MPNARGVQHGETVVVPGVEMNGEEQVVRVVIERGDFNWNYLNWGFEGSKSISLGMREFVLYQNLSKVGYS